MAVPSSYRRSLVCATLVGVVACGGPGGIVTDYFPSGVDASPPPPIPECNPIAQIPSTCARGEKCGWIVLQEAPEHIGASTCQPNGSVPLGASCIGGAPGPAGFSNCESGSECVGDICELICSLDGTDLICGAPQACVAHVGLFDGLFVAGVCE